MSSSNQVMTANGFLSTLGVNTHIPYTDGEYSNIPLVISDLKYLGITQVRDEVSSGSAPISSYESLASAGIHFTFMVSVANNAAIETELTFINQLEAADPGCVTAIEGANEINNWPVTYNGVGGLQGAINLQTAIVADVAADPSLKGVPIDYFTGSGYGGIAVGPNPITSGLATYDNQHPYPQDNEAPAYWVSRPQAFPNAPSATTPAVFTETGYNTDSVSVHVQAAYELDMLMDAAQEGVSKTYLYELMDAYAPGSAQGDAGWGLFDNSEAPKPVATGIHDLTTLLQDTGATAGSFTPTPLTYTLSGLPTTGNSMVMEKSNGTYVISAWAEPQLWNNSTNTEITAPTETVTLKLGANYGSIQVFDPLTGTTAISSASNANSITFALTDHPILIEVSNPVTVAPPTVGVTSQVLAKDTGTSATDNITSNGSVTLTGTVTGTTGTTVKVLDGTTALGNATLTTGGGWNFSTVLGTGTHSLSAVAIETNGTSISSAAEPTIIVETTPTISFAAPVQSGSMIDLSGTVSQASGTGVQVFNGSTLLGNATISSGGAWTYTAPATPGTYAFTATATDAAGDTASTADPTLTITGTQTDALVLNLSEDAYLGNAQFTVDVDGKQVGGTQTITALHGSNLSENFTVSTNLTPGAHTIAVDFLNDAYAGTPTTDRNLYVNAISVNGMTTVENAAQDSGGTHSYAVVAPPTDSLVLNVSEDAYQGDAQFTVNVDGTQVGGTLTSTALHSTGASQNIALLGNFGAGPHTVTVDFLNDDYGGTATTDRNLYVNSISIDGVTTSENTEQGGNGNVSYAVTSPVAGVIATGAQLLASAGPSLSNLKFIAPTNTVVATGASQTLFGAPSDVLVGSSVFGDLFSGSSATMLGDTIQNFGGSDKIDLTDILASKIATLGWTSNSTGGVLSVTDGSHTAALTLTGSFTQSNFAFASDGAAGTMITRIG